MPAGRGNDEAERFAAALDQGRSPRSISDDELARDLEIVAMLRASRSAYAPDPDAKARARRRALGAIAEQGVAARAGSITGETISAPDHGLTSTPRNRVDALRDQQLAAEITTRIDPVVEPAYEYDEYDAADEFEAEFDEAPELDEGRASSAHGAVRTRGRRTGRHKLPTRPSRAAGSSGPGRGGRSLLRRAVMTASAAMLAIVAIAGGGMFASRDALPGDSLYGVKRVAESAGLALTFDDAARAARHLELASTRLGEVEQLVDTKRTQKADPTLVKDAILDFDSATGEGSNLLLTEDEAHDPAKLADLQAWAADQVSRISTMRSGLPASAQAEADHSIELLDRLRERAAELADRSACDDVTSGSTDDVGPIPATSDCDATSARADDEDGPTTRAGKPSRGAGSSADADSDEPRSGDTTATPDGLLPGILGDTPSSSSTPEDESSSETSSAGPTTKPSINVPLPLPLLPPINLPPLLPGGRGITIGG